MSTIHGDPQQTTTTLLPPVATSFDTSIAVSRAPLPTSTSSLNTSASSSHIDTGLNAGEKVGIAVACIAVLAVFVWWFWPKKWKRRPKFKADTPQPAMSEAKQNPETEITEAKGVDGKHLPGRVKTI
ncbi:hypothetical protein N7G274_007524 [Stereocaulon virgatum]|uniref:Uncharacterized protein n=1 Tax=Stereocaulon virgatum TaxID=373712 RepID=A0ABR4A1B9_9LECA